MPRMQPLVLCGAAFLGLALGTGAASAEDKTFDLKMSHWVPTTFPCIRRSRNGAPTSRRPLAARSNIRCFRRSSSARRSTITTWRATASPISLTSIPAISPAAPDHRSRRIAVSDRRCHGGIRAIDSWYRKYAASEMKDVKYCFSYILDPLTWHSKSKKIVVPADIKGMKIRPSQGTVAAWVTLLGGNNVQASATEVRDIMAKGVADAVNFPWGSISVLGVDKVTKYHMEAPLNTVMFQWLINPKTYAAMSPAQQKVIDDHCTTEWAAKLADPWADWEHAGLEKIKALPGHEVYKITDEQLEEWKKSAQPLLQKWADAVRSAGGDPDKIMKELKASLAQYNASY